MADSSERSAPGGPFPQVFRYTKPDFASDRRKAVRRLGRTDIAIAAMQIIRHGGEETLHSHTNLDGVWTVIRGRARFYTSNDALVAELGPLEGVVIPRGYPYWFESTGDEDLEILQFEAACEPLGSGGFAAGRINLAPRLKSTTDHADIYQVVRGPNTVAELPAEPSGR